MAVKNALSQQLNDEEAVARAISHYLQAHPDAADTLEGIAQWWLLRECTERKLAEVEHALAILLAKGSIVQVIRPGHPPYFRLNKQPENEVTSDTGSANEYQELK